MAVFQLLHLSSSKAPCKQPCSPGSGFLPPSNWQMGAQGCKPVWFGSGNLPWLLLVVATGRGSLVVLYQPWPRQRCSSPGVTHLWMASTTWLGGHPSPKQSGHRPPLFRLQGSLAFPSLGVSTPRADPTKHPYSPIRRSHCPVNLWPRVAQRDLCQMEGTECVPASFEPRSLQLSFLLPTACWVLPIERLRFPDLKLTSPRLQRLAIPR